MRININAGPGKVGDKDVSGYTLSVALKRDDVMRFIEYMQQLIREDGDYHFHISNSIEDALKQGRLIDIQFYRDANDASNAGKFV